MRRFLIIFLVFALLACSLTACNVVFKDEDGGKCRGLGYTCVNIGIGCIDDCDCSSQDITQTYTNYDIAIEGTHYTKPEISFSHYEDVGGIEYTISFTALWDITTVKYEICFVQNGVLLGKVSKDYYNCITNETYTQNGTISASKYSEDGGEIYYIINRFEARYLV